MNSLLQKIKEDVSDLPAISGNSIRILNLIAKEDYQVCDLVKLIGMDVTLSTHCLRIVNSAAYSLHTPITSIERAVNYLGEKTILNLVINREFDWIYSSPLKGYKREHGVLWEHSLKTAVASRQVARANLTEGIDDAAYAAGLLHDMGKIIISHYLDKLPSDIKKKFEIGEKNDFQKVESQLLKTDHAEVGYIMADHWGIPVILQMAIRYHHVPRRAPVRFKKVCFVVHVGDILAMLGSSGTGCDTFVYHVDPETEMYLDINPGVLENLLYGIDTEYMKMINTTFMALESANV